MSFLNQEGNRPESKWRQRLYTIIFESDTSEGKLFDLILLALILISVLAVMLETVQAIHNVYGQGFYLFEWMITLLFTVEYGFRILAVRDPSRYVLSFFGVVDLLAILPTYLSLIIPGSQYLLVIRVLRLLRVFRVLKLTRYMGEANVLMMALRASSVKITVFLFGVLTIVIIVGALMYLVEGPEHGFVNIPISVYWAIVTLTTVGFGDITPGTPLGRMLASMVMILGYGIIAVPTGIVSVELAQATRIAAEHIMCSACGKTGLGKDASYCMYCGESMAGPSVH